MLSRRSVLLGGAAALGAAPFPARAQTPADGPPPTILRAERRSIEVNSRPAAVYAIRQPDGTFGLTAEVGKAFRVRLENHIDEPTLIHWHGLTPPWRQDGVPGISGPPIPAGGSVDYDFPLNFGGTFWMHSHEGLQEQLLMSAPLIIHDERDRPEEQEVVVMLADFSFTPPEEIYANLRKSGSMSGMGKGAGMTMGKGQAGGMMMMSGMKAAKPAAPDLNDVKYDAFLANFRTLADPEIVKVEPGGRALLRIIAGSSMTNFHLDLGQLEGELIAVDGFAIEPIRGRSFPLAVAQRLDIRVSVPPGAGAYPVVARVEGERSRTGIVLVAGSAEIARLPGEAEAASPALTLDFERSLRAVKPLAPRKADRIHTLNLTRRDGRLCLVDQRCRVESGRAAVAGRRGRAGRTRVRQPDADAPSDASARARVPGGGDRRRAL